MSESVKKSKRIRRRPVHFTSQAYSQDNYDLSANARPSQRIYQDAIRPNKQTGTTKDAAKLLINFLDDINQRARQNSQHHGNYEGNIHNNFNKSHEVKYEDKYHKNVNRVKQNHKNIRLMNTSDQRQKMNEEKNQSLIKKIPQKNYKPLTSPSNSYNMQGRQSQYTVDFKARQMQSMIPQQRTNIETLSSLTRGQMVKLISQSPNSYLAQQNLTLAKNPSENKGFQTTQFLTDKLLKRSLFHVGAALFIYVHERKQLGPDNLDPTAPARKMKQNAEYKIRNEEFQKVNRQIREELMMSNYKTKAQKKVKVQFQDGKSKFLPASKQLKQSQNFNPPKESLNISEIKQEDIEPKKISSNP